MHIKDFHSQKVKPLRCNLQNGANIYTKYSSRNIDGSVSPEEQTTAALRKLTLPNDLPAVEPVALKFDWMWMMDHRQRGPAQLDLAVWRDGKW